jgi:hypothetical protein
VLTVDVEAGVDVVVDSPCVVDGSLGVGVGSGVGVGFGLVLLLTKVVPISPVYPSGFLFNAAVTPDAVTTAFGDIVIFLSLSNP